MLSSCVHSVALPVTTPAGAEVEFISDDHDLSARLPGAALLLVNRVLDGEFPDPGGVELIARTARAGVPAILISNFPDAQAAAQAAGARPGFGKNAMNSEQAGEMIRAAAKI